MNVAIARSKAHGRVGYVTTEDRLKRDIAWIEQQAEARKRAGRQTEPASILALARLKSLLNRMKAPIADTAQSVVAEFMTLLLGRLRWELQRQSEIAGSIALDALADRLSMASGLMLRLKSDTERWREVSPHIGWRCRAIHNAISTAADDAATEHGVYRESDDDDARMYRARLNDLRHDIRSDVMQAYVDAVGIITIIANDFRATKTTGISACRDAAMAYIDSLRGI